MTYRLDQLPAAQFLTDAEQRKAIGIIQLADMWRKLDGGPAQVEEAYDALTRAFQPAIQRAARASKVQDADDAYGNALEAFVLAVQEYDLSVPEYPFSKYAASRLHRHISDTDRTSGTIRIPEGPGARYWKLMHAHGHDVEAAYQACKDPAVDLSTMSFLAIHHAMSGALSLDYTVTNNNADAGTMEGGAFNAEYGAGAVGEASRLTVPGPEEQAVERHLIAWLFTLVTDRQETILRLRHGFLDLPTDTIRLNAGHATGAFLTEEQIAHALGLSRRTIRDDQAKALTIMREAMQALVLEEEA